MFGLGWTEILVIAAIAIIVVPPKDLPGLMRNVGRWVGKARRVMRDFQREVEDAVRVDELPKLKRQVEEISRKTNADFMRDLQVTPTSRRLSQTGTSPEAKESEPGQEAPAMTPLPAEGASAEAPADAAAPASAEAPAEAPAAEEKAPASPSPPAKPAREASAPAEATPAAAKS
jgi:sec-independent protein translocase protein TatB